MEKSEVYISMKDDKNSVCSWAIVKKKDKFKTVSILLVLSDKETAIFDYNSMLISNKLEYLLLKQYPDSNKAYMDFMKLIGKMCKKSIESKYFLNHISEDNRMIVESFENEMMITSFNGCKEDFDNRKKIFLKTVSRCFAEKVFTFAD
jgi:superfamily I DNA/RNA helicase